MHKYGFVYMFFICFFSTSKFQTSILLNVTIVELTEHHELFRIAVWLPSSFEIAD